MAEREGLFLVLLLGFSQAVQRYNCPLDALQLITNEQVIESAIVTGDDFTFRNVISVSSFVTLYWSGGSSSLPNNGTLIFDEPFVIIGLTTTGEVVLGDLDVRYVSNFSVSYSDTLNSTFKIWPKHFTINTPNEVAFSFAEPILTKRLRIFINSAAQGNKIYYWRLNLFGCPQKNATIVPEPSSTSYALSPSSDPTVDSSPMCPSLDSIMTPVTIITTVTVRTTVTTSSNSAPVEINTVNSRSSSCQGAVTAAIIVPILLIVLMVLIVLGVAIYFYKKKYPSKRTRSETLREVSNVQLYTAADGTYDKSAVMTYNSLYDSLNSPVDITCEGLQLPPMSQENEIYTEVDHHYEETPMGRGNPEQTPVGGATYEKIPMSTYEETPVGGAETPLHGYENVEMSENVKMSDNSAYHSCNHN